MMNAECPFTHQEFDEPAPMHRCLPHSWPMLRPVELLMFERGVYLLGKMLQSPNPYLLPEVCSTSAARTWLPWLWLPIYQSRSSYPPASTL